MKRHYFKKFVKSVKIKKTIYKGVGAIINLDIVFS